MPFHGFWSSRFNAANHNGETAGKSHFGKLPEAHFSLLARLPRVEAVGQALPIFLMLRQDESKSTTSSPPLVHLKSSHIDLESTFWIRCAAEGNKAFCAGIASSKWSMTIPKARLDHFSAMPEIMDLSELWIRTFSSTSSRAFLKQT